MSVYGGDSWGGEASHRKRRLDDLLLDNVAGDESSSCYKKLNSGKYVCLVCPHNPVLDTPLMLSMHMKAKRHLAAETRVKQREEERENEMNKRIALSLDSTSSKQTTNVASKPLTEKTRKATFELLHHTYPAQTAANDIPSRRPISESASYESASVQIQASGNAVVQLPLYYRERRERELKFTSAGWKRDCNGGWFRDENVEFDSDEEDPNEAFTTGERVVIK